MRIGELARRSGLSASRIRFYEASGLIAAQRLGNGYRDYPEQALAVLELIACGQQAGFSLEEMRHLLPSPGQVHGNHERMLEGLRRKVAEIEAMQARLVVARERLLQVIDSIEDKPEGMGCQENAERVLGRLRGGTQALPQR